MASPRSWFARWWSVVQVSCRVSPRPSRRSAQRHQFAPQLEPLEERMLLTASVPDWSTREEVVEWIGNRDYLPDELIVAYRAPSGAESVTSKQSLSQSLPELQTTRSLGNLPQASPSAAEATAPNEELLSVKLRAGSDIPKLLQQLSQDANVAWAAPNFVYAGSDPRDFTPNDPSYASQYHHTRMQTNLAWDTTLGSSSIIVAVTDDGTDWDHVDLAANIWNNSDEIAGNGLDDDANGFIDDVRGWDFSSNDNDPNHVGTDDHGTHVAGIVAARTNNAIGVAGTAGGSTIMPIRFYGSGAWTSTVIFNSYKYATDNGAKIISTSYNIDGFVGDPTFTSALDYAYTRNVLHFNSAGNNSQLNPVRQTFDQMVFVASTEANDAKSSFSNYGYGTDISAPGGSIYATLPGDLYGTKSGTSMATPNAAAVAALIWSAHPTWTRDQVAAQIMGTADNIDGVNPTFAGNLGSGRANAFRGVTETIVAPRFKGLVEVPTDGMTLTTAPTTITVSLGSVFDEAGIETAGNWELRSDGANNVFDDGDDVVIPLTRTTNYMIGSNRVAFTVGSTLGADRYRFRALSSGISSPFGVALDGDGNGTAGGNFVRTFSVSTPIGVASLSPAAGAFVSLPLTSIDVNFDQAYAPASVGTNDLILSQGTVTAFTLIDADTVRYTVSGITRDGTLSVQLPANAVTDLSGNASVAFSGSLTVDVTTATLAAPSVVNPSGALIYDTSVTGTVGQSADTDSYTLDINAGQTITVIVTPTGGLQGNLSVTGPGVSQSASGATANAPFVAQSISAANAGTYTFSVSGVSGTTGGYTLRVVLNAAAESEAYGGGANDSTATAQDLASSAMTLGGGATRLAVLGTMTGGTSQTDVYALSATLGQTLTVSWSGIGTGTMELLNSTGTVLAGAIAGPTNLNYLIANYVVTATSTYYVRVVSSMAGSYAVVATLGAAFDTESNHDFANAQNISASGAVLGSIKAANSGFAPASEALSGPIPLISNFAGPNLTGFIPPDPTNAAGPAQIVAVVNTTLAIYDKSTGAQLFSQNMNGSTGFFASVGATTTVFDPHALYDFETQRFFVIAVDIAGSTSNIFVAVSKTSTPTGGNDWHKYKIDFTHTPSGATAALGSGAHFPDYPKVGINSDALWIAGNYFAISSGSGTYAGLTALAKTPLLSGAAATKVYEEYFSGFSVFPVHSYGSSPVQYFAETSTGSGSTIRVHAVSNVLTSPTRSVATITVPSFSAPVNPPQLGGGTGADAVDARVMTGVWRNGQLYFAHAITVPGGDGEDVVRWYQVATNNYPASSPTLTQSGNVDPGAGVHAWMPGINVDAAGNMGLVFSTGGANMYYSIGYTGRLSTDPAGTVALPVSTLFAGQGNYVRTDSFGRNRWGDYAGLALDPNDGATFWGFHGYAATGNNWATRVGSFQLAAPVDEDWYTFSVTSGANLTLVTSTPSDAGLAFLNTLDPAIELYDPSGSLVAFDNNSAGDGRNARITYTALTSGNYRVRTTASGTTRGEYLLRVTGGNSTDPAAAVIDTDPDNGSSLSSFPTTIALNFSEALLATSVQAGDVTINGIAATAVTRLDGDSYQFTIPAGANTGDRVYAIVAAAGAFTDLQSNLSTGYTGSFTLDGTAPKITSITYNGTAIPANKTFNAGPFTLVASFTELLFNNNSPRRGLLSPGTDDVRLVNTSTGQTVAATALTYDSGNNQVTIAFPSLGEGQYALTLISGDNGFEDLVGNNLDGEPLGAGVDGTPTGNGAPGGDYTLTFFVDGVSAPFPVPLKSVANLGSLVYQGTAATLLSSSTDTDAFTINLEAGQSFSVAADPATGLRPTVTVLDPNSISVGSTTAAATGQEALLQNIAVTSAGTYTVVIGAAGGTTGSVSVTLVLNAAIEAESHDGATNHTLATAQSLDSGFVSLGGVAASVAVLGVTDIAAGALASELEPNDSTATANDAAANFTANSSNLYQMILRGNRSTGTDVDYFNIGTLDAGDVITISQVGTNGGRGTIGDSYLYLYRAGGGTPVQMASDDDSGVGLDSLIHRFSVTTADTYYIAASGYSSSYTGIYELGVRLENSGAAPNTGGTFIDEVENNDTTATANDASASWRAIQYLSRTAGSVAATGDVDVYQYRFNAGDLVTVNIDSTSTLDARVDLLSSTGTVIALEDGTTIGPGTDSPIYAFRIPTTGVYYVQVRAASGTGSYNADVYLSATTAPPAPSPPTVDDYSVTLTAGQSISAVVERLGSTGSLDMRLVDNSGTSLAVGVASDVATRRFVRSYVAASSGTYHFQVFGTNGVPYNLVVTRGADLDVGDNGTLATAQPPQPATTVLGAIESAGLGRLYVYDATAAQIRELNPQTGAILRSFASPVAATSSPDFGLATTPTSVLAGGIASSAIYELNPDTGATIRTITNPTISISGLAFANNEIYVLTDSVSGQITVIDYSTGTVKRTLSTGLPISEGLASDGTSILGSNGSNLYTINPVSGSATSTRSLSVTQEGIGVIGSELFLAGSTSVSVYDLSTLTFKRTLSGLNDLEAIGADGGTVDSDYYSLAVNAGSTITLTTRTPGDAAGEFANVLDPALELYNPSGTLVAANDNGAGDGRNAVISHLATVTGTYKVRVYGAASTGEYVLTMSGGSGAAAPFAVSDSVPAAGAVLSAAPAKGVINFNDGILLTSLTAADITFQGSAVTGLNVLDGNSLEFDLPASLTAGSYTIAIAAGAIQDLQGTPLAAFAATFSIDNNNDPPVISVPATLASEEDQALTITGLGISDLDSGTANISVVLSVIRGILALGTLVSGGVTAGQIVGNGTATITVTAPVANIHATFSAGAQYIPSPNFAGTDRLVVQANDLGNTGGTAQIDSDSVLINISEVNDRPVRLTGTVNTITGSISDPPRSLGLGGVTYGPGGGVDEAAQTLTITVAEVPNPSLGTIVRADDLIPLTVGQTLSQSELQGLRFVAAGALAGNARFSFDVTDNGKTGGFNAPQTLSEEQVISIVARFPVSYLGDINTAPGHSDPSNLVTVGNVAFYTAYSPESGVELWRSDGSSSGTYLVKDVRTGGQGGGISNLTVVGEQVFFAAFLPAFGAELWVTDGTASGTRLVRDISAGTSANNGTSSGSGTTFSTSGFANFGGTLYFNANSSLWRSDGTSSGTGVISTAASSPTYFVNAGGTLFFSGSNAAAGTELWKSDGTSSGTVLVADMTPGSTSSTFNNLVAVGNAVFFRLSSSTAGLELWRSDGTSSGTGLVRDIGAGTVSGSPTSLTNVNGVLYFAATDAANGAELWRSDGTSSGTFLVRDIFPGTSGSLLSNLVSHSNTLYFSAWGPIGNSELWKSDGTSSGTVMVRDINPSGPSYPTGMTNVNGTLYFAALSSTTGLELYRTDGTSTGTVLVRDVFPGASGGVTIGSIQRPIGVGDLVLFTGNDGLTGRQLWKSDGTSAGTSVLRVINSATDNSGILTSNVALVGNWAYFAADNPLYGRELWKTDGTSVGTQLVANINPDSASSSPSNMTVMGNRLYFTAFHPSFGTELWTSDGTASGTTLVRDIRAGTSSSSPGQLVNFNGTLYFVASDGVGGAELWRSDGTSTGTQLVRDTIPGATSSSIANLGGFGNLLFFTNFESVNGTELWRSDGTSSGTFVVKDIAAGTSSSSPNTFFAYGNQVLFRASDGVNGVELWITDGTSTGTQLLSDINPGSSGSSPFNFTLFNGRVFFSALTAANGTELWVTDGTSSGTRLLVDILAGASSSFPASFADVNGTLYFSAFGAPSGLWRTDGTSSGTYLVNGVGTSAREITNLNGILIYSANTTGNGFELWRSDGTSAGTFRLETVPGAAEASPFNLRVLGNRVYYRAFEPSTGFELWRTDGTSSGTALVADAFPGIGDSFPTPLGVVNGRLLMTGLHPTFGNELMVLEDFAPTTTGIPSFDVPVNAPNTVVDLTQYFFDDVTPSAGLTYTLLNVSNPALFDATTVDSLLGRLTLDYAANAIGQANITVVASDAAGNTVSTTFTVRVGVDVNDPPLQLLPSVVQTNEDTSVVISGLSITDTDAGVATVRVILTANNGVLSLTGLTTGTLSGNSTATLTIDAPLAAINQALVTGLVYTPPANFSGSSFLTVTTNDLGRSGSGGPQLDTDTLAIVVRELNDAPINVLPSSPVGMEDTPLAITGLTITDVDNSNPFSVVFSAAAGSVLTLSTTVAGGVVAGQITGNGTNTVTVVGALSAINATLTNANGLMFTAPLNFNGSVALTIVSNDLNLASAALADSDALTIHIGEVNDQPVRTGGSLETRSHNADSMPQSLGLSLLQYVGGLGSDELGQALSVTLNTVPSPGLGTVVRAGDLTPLAAGTVLTLSDFQGLRFVAPQGASGAGTLAFTVTDFGTTLGVADPRSLSESIALAVTPRTPITLTRDINQLPANADPTTAVNLNGIAIYTAFTYEHGTELWRSDGTSSGTYLLRDIRPGGRSSSIANLTVVGNTVLFSASDGIIGTELWKTDGTSTGTLLVSDILPGLTSGGPVNLVNVNGTLFFSTFTSSFGTELYKSDGTSSGTVLVRDIHTSGSSSPSFLINANGVLYFEALSPTTGRELWVSDGTSAGTQLVFDLFPGTSNGSIGNFRPLGTSLFFTANDGTTGGEMWFTDGTSGGTRLLADITTGTGSTTLAQQTIVGNQLFFTANTTTFGTELWRSDGTTAGTYLVADLAAGTASSTPSNLVNLNGLLLFSATGTTTGTELFRSDGTSAGTSVVNDIVSGASSSSPLNLAIFNGAVYFSAFSGSGFELWKSNGSSSGTQLVADIYPGGLSSSPSSLVAGGNTLYFMASNGVNGNELWRTDGTSSGTTITRDLIAGTASATITNIVPFGDRVLFRFGDSLNGRELWTSDGTSSGTQLVKDANLGTTDALSSPFFAANGIVYFAADDGVNGRELWRSDGTQFGTYLVRDIAVGPNFSTPANFAEMNGIVYFSALDNSLNTELWRTDGTSSGTYLVADITPGSNASSPGNLVAVGNALFFQATTAANGRELWKSDGTSSGTVLVADLIAGSVGSTIGNMIPVGNNVLFSFNDPVTGTELWRSDGTSSGTAIVLDIRAGLSNGFSNSYSIATVNGIAYFRGNDGTSGAELWRSDGTSSGTYRVVDLNPGASSSSPASIVNLNGTLVFMAATTATGTELFRSDGTSAGTNLVADVRGGSSTSSPASLTNVNGTLYFTADDGSNGSELWRTDGTSTGTLLVRDITPGTAGSTLSSVTAAGNALFFRFFDPVSGFELWRSDGTCAGTRLVQDLFPGLPDSYPINLVPAGDRLFFQAFDGQVGNELFVFDDRAPTSIGLANRTVGLDTSVLNIDLFPVFADDITLDSQLTLTIVSNSNPNLFSSTTIDGPTGRLSLTFNGTAVGASVLALRATDAIGQSVDTLLTVIRDGSVNAAPTLDPIGGVSVDEDALAQDISLTGITSGAGDPPQVLAITATSSDPSIVPHPQIFYASPNNFGTLRFTPLANVSGTVTITVTVQDDGGTGNGGIDTTTRTFTITVNSVNDRPANTVPATQTVNEDTPLAFSAAAGRAITVSDVDAGTATIRVTLAVSSGLISVGGQTGASLTLDDTAANLNAALNSLVFQPLANFNGPVSLTITSNDLGNTGSGGAQADVDTVTINVTAVNDAPVNQVPGAQQINVNSPLVFSASTGKAISISDIDAGTAAVRVTISATGGTLTLGAQVGVTSLTLTDTVANINSALDGLIFTPPTNAVGGGVVTITTNDQGNTGGTTLTDVDSVAISIVATNAAPVLNSAGSPKLADVQFGSSTNNGSLVSEILNSALETSPITDPDVGDPQGIAITAADNSHGSWQYSLDNGTNWLALGSPSVSVARLLAADSGTRIRWLPTPGYFGRLNAGLTFQAWDQSAGVNGGTANVSVSGGVTPYSLANDTISVALVSPHFAVTGSALTINAPNGGSYVSLQFLSATSFFFTVANQTLAMSTNDINSIVVNAASGADLFSFVLPPTADQVVFTNARAQVTGTNYTLDAVGFETNYVFGTAEDSGRFVDQGGQHLLYMLPTHSIMVDPNLSFYNLGLGFGSYHGTGAQDDDLLFFYNSQSGGSITGSSTGANTTSDGVSLVASAFRNEYMYALAGNSTAVYNGSTEAELYTSWPGYVFINNSARVRYFQGFSQVTVNSGGGDDAAVYYDSPGNDTFTSVVARSELTGTGYRNIAVDYNRAYAFSVFGGSDTANLTGSNGNDSIYAEPTTTLISSGSFVQQVLYYSVINVSGGSGGFDGATLVDSRLNDDLIANPALLELRWGTGQRVSLAAIDTVFARGINGGTNRRTIAAGLPYTLAYDGVWT